MTRRAAVKAARTPGDVGAMRCMARVQGRGDVPDRQCERKALPGDDFCWQHTTTKRAAAKTSAKAPGTGAFTPDDVEALARVPEPEAWAEFDSGNGVCSNEAGWTCLDSLEQAKRALKAGYRLVAPESAAVEAG